MLRIIHLDRTGVFVAMRGGRLTAIGGREHWSTAEDARRAAQAENAPIHERVLRTRP